MHLPDDVALTTSNHHGKHLRALYTLWSAWVEAIGENEDALFGAMLDATDCFQSSTFDALHGYYRSALSNLRTALDLVAIGTVGNLTPTDPNAWLSGFVEDYNKRFGRAPANAKDLHRPLTEGDDLDEILAWREERSVTRNLTLRYDRMMLLLDPTPFARGLAGKKVEVVNYPDGRFAVRHEGAALPFRVFDKIQTVAPGAIVENKRLGAALAFARELQASYPPNRRRGDLRRQRPPNNLEAPGMPTKGRASRKVLATAAAE
jgi:hypothetical protein